MLTHPRICIAVFLLTPLFCFPHLVPSAGAETDTNAVITPSAPKMEPGTQLNPPQAKSASYITNQLDNIHDDIFLRLQRPAQRVDDFFAGKDVYKRSTTISRFRLGLYLMVKDEDALSTRFEPDVEAEIRLPNLEERWGIFVDSMRNNDLPGTDPTERESSLNTGLRRVYDDWKMHADVGVRWRGGPAGMARLEWRPDFSIGKTKFYPRERVFYESWNGFGEMTSLTVNRTIGCFFARLVSGATWTESSNGLEWEQTAILGHAGKLIENKPRELVTDEDVAKGLSIRYSIFGHNSTDQHRIDRHRMTLVYRYPIYKNWLFLQIAPGIEWRDESNWENIPSIQIGFDTLFWEVVQPRSLPDSSGKQY